MKKYWVSCVAEIKGDDEVFRKLNRGVYNNDFVAAENPAEAIENCLEAIAEMCMEGEAVDYCEIDRENKRIFVYDFDNEIISIFDDFEADLIDYWSE